MVVRIYSRALFAILYFFVGILICHLARAETVTPNKLITDTDHIELDNFYCWSDSDPEWPHHYDEPACIEKANGRVFRDSQNNLVVKGKNNNAIR